jgi:hypothetical protein
LRAAGILAAITGTASIFVSFSLGVTAVLAALAVSIWLIRWADERRTPARTPPQWDRYRGIFAAFAGWGLFGGLLLLRWPISGFVLGIAIFALSLLERAPEDSRGA